MLHKMEQPCIQPTSQPLWFCIPCGLKRVCDVIDDLQKLFRDRCVEPNICGICHQKVVQIKTEIESPPATENLREEKDIEISIQPAAAVQVMGASQEDDDDAYENYTLSDEDDCDADVDNGSGDGDASTSKKIASAKCDPSIKTRPQATLSRQLKRKAEQEQVGRYDGATKTTSQEKALKSVKIGLKKEQVCEMETTENAKPKISHKTKQRKKITADREQVDLSILNNDAPMLGRSTRLRTGAITATKYAAMVEEEELSSDEKDSARSDNDERADSDSDLDPEIIELMEMEEMSEGEFSEEEARPQVCGPKYIDPEVLELMNPMTGDPNSARSAFKFQCKFCDKQFPYITSFLKHVSSHTGKAPIEKPYKCDHCNENFAVKPFSKHKFTHRNRTLKCTYRGCKYTFTEKKTLRSHLRVHKGLRRYLCKKCGLGFQNKSNLSVHESEHTNEIHLCKECGLTFTDTSQLRQHDAQVHKETKKKYRCNQCHECIGATKRQLRVHQQKHHGLKISTTQSCKKCKSVFLSRTLLKHHLQEDSCEQVEDDIDIKESLKFVDPRLVAMIGKPRSLDKPFRCKYCTLTEFQKPQIFITHLQKQHPDVECPVTHAYYCDQCDKKFKRRDKLASHSISHSDYRPYKCTHENCDKRFKNLKMLNSHTGRHASDFLKFMCSKCGKRFGSMGKVKQHDNSVHLKLRPAKCTQCGKNFSSKHKLQAHKVRVHQNLRPWICEVCGKSYKEKSELIRHTYSHTGEKPYACDQCEYRCVRLDYLRKHQRIHSGEKPYVCDVCDKPFALRTTLVFHQKKHHGTEQRQKTSKLPATVTAAADAVAATDAAAASADVTINFPAPNSRMENEEKVSVENIIAAEFLQLSKDGFGQSSTFINL